MIVLVREISLAALHSAFKGEQGWLTCKRAPQADGFGEASSTSAKNDTKSDKNLKRETSRTIKAFLRSHCYIRLYRASERNS